MLIIGSKGHARDILSVFEQLQAKYSLSFYDDYSTDVPDKLFGKYKIIRTLDAAKELFRQEKEFVLGVGNPLLRYQLAAKMRAAGGELFSLISPTAAVGTHEVHLGAGLNVMSQVVITNQVFIGEGSLINAHVSIHHDVQIGKYCEISPGARISGGCKVGDFCSIGLNAVLLPKVKIGNNVVVGAGCIVNKEVGDNQIVAGIPARVIRKLDPIRLDQQ